MATLAQRTRSLEERTDRLETIIVTFSQEAASDREESARFREEMALQAAQDREESAREREESARFREEMARQAAQDRAESAREREESARFREEMARQAAQDREESAREREESARFREEVARQAAQDREESARFRDEMARQAAQDREESAREREESARFLKEMELRAARHWENIDRYFEEGAREHRQMNKRWGELANKMGTVVEDIVAPSVRRLAREVFGCGELQYFSPRVSLKRSDDRSREREFDALYVGTRGVLLNETKSSPRSEDLRAFVEFLHSGKFALYFPEYRELPIVPVFSSLSIPAHMVKYLTRRGIYALAMGDEAMQVLNLDAVRRS